jgi:hypothetical protein
MPLKDIGLAASDEDPVGMNVRVLISLVAWDHGSLG